MNALTNQPNDPLISPFDNPEQEASYSAWLNNKFDRSISDPRPNIAHDDVMAQIKHLLQAKAPHAAS